MCGYLPFGKACPDIAGICADVLKGEWDFPKTFKDAEAKELIRGLLEVDPTKRLGAGLGGWDQCMELDFFANAAQDEETSYFDMIQSHELSPPVVPKPFDA